MNSFKKTRNMVMAAAIAAIIVIMAFVPFLGYIPLGIMNATTVHIPVIIGAILLGPRYGAFLGLTFGLTSLWKNTFMPNPTSFVFSPFAPPIGDFGSTGNIGSLLICLIPRILIGIVSYYVYAGLMKAMRGKEKRQGICLMCAGIAGSMTNTLLVMNLIYFIFGQKYAAAAEWSGNIYRIIMGIIGAQGVPEAIVAGILTTAVTKVMFTIKAEA